MNKVKDTPSVILSNITRLIDLLLNLNLEIVIVGLHILYIINMHTNFHVNRMLFTIISIISSTMHYFKLQKIEFKQLIDDMTIDL